MILPKLTKKLKTISFYILKRTHQPQKHIVGGFIQPLVHWLITRRVIEYASIYTQKLYMYSVMILDRCAPSTTIKINVLNDDALWMNATHPGYAFHSWG